jgi:hypothetical protein
MTLADPPVIFADRDAQSALAKRADSVLSAMRDWGVGRVDEKETVHFCGLVHHPESGSVVFLPRESRTGDDTEDLNTASLTLQALARFGAETSKRDLEEDGEIGNPGILSVIKRLSDDFRRHGLFSERTRARTRNSGKPDWVRTIKNEIAMPDRNGQPVFTDIRTSRAARNTDALLSQIQAAVLREVYAAHSWWLSGSASGQQTLSLCSRPPFPRSIWAKKLDGLLPSLYSARSLFLAEYLRYYLRETRASQDGTFVFGVSDFHTVWETILRETAIRSSSDRRRNWNSELPKPTYYYPGSDSHVARSRGMQTDIILEHSSSFTIVDAKYYAAKSAETAPGWPDIAKQIFYEKALREVVQLEGGPAIKIDNVFAFPSLGNVGNLERAEMRHVDGSAVSDAFTPVVCSYISVKEALSHYVSRTQGIELRV